MACNVPSDFSAERNYRRKVMQAPMLDAKRELALATRWRKEADEAALHELTQAYIRFVISIASKYRHYGLPMPDLISEGNVGLMVAAARFEPERGFRFSTYAGWWIRSTIQEYVLRNWSIVRIGSTSAQKSLFFKLRRLRAQIGDTGAGGMDPENQKWVADTLGVRERDVDLMASRLSASDKSLNAPIDQEGAAEWQDLLMDERAHPEQEAIGRIDSRKVKDWIERALHVLSPREVNILRQRYLSDKPVTLAKLGSELGISKERVRQVEAQALNKLRFVLERLVGELDRLELLS
ncbi:MAG: RNA polymerase factor sigma-32 [Gammaproteobacteria bacterium]|nr:RNA polymerase factor sigma-32 [Gammaproteobacteria bacterium]